eukprot:4103010-Lingulodinium_polyedra.AAC.1
MVGWAAEDILLYMDSGTVSVYHSLSESQTEDDVDLPREYTTVMPHVATWSQFIRWPLSPCVNTELLILGGQA